MVCLHVLIVIHYICNRLVLSYQIGGYQIGKYMWCDGPIVVTTFVNGRVAIVILVQHYF